MIAEKHKLFFFLCCTGSSNLRLYLGQMDLRCSCQASSLGPVGELLFWSKGFQAPLS